MERGSRLTATIEPAEEDGYQLIHLELCISIQNYYDAAQNMNYNNSKCTYSMYDWYTGRMLPVRGMSGSDSFNLVTTLDIDGISYDVSYTLDNHWEFESWIYDDSGNARSNGRCYMTYMFKVPNGYDGLVFGVTPTNEYVESDTETVHGTDEDGAVFAFDENVYVDGTAYFRINKEGMISERTAAE